MVSRRHLRHQPDPNFVVRPLRRSSLVYAPPLPPLPEAMHTWLVERQILSSRDGRDIAEVIRGAGNAMLVAHANAAVPPQTFDENIQLLHVGPDSVRLWGRRGSVCGVWNVTAHGARFVAKLPGVTRILRSPLGGVPVYEGKDGKQFVRGDRLVTVSKEAEVFFGEDGRVHAACPLFRVANGERIWVVLEEPDARTDVPYRDEVGDSPRLLPFTAARVRPFQRGACVLRMGGRDAISFVDKGVIHALPFDPRLGLDCVWSSPDDRRMAMLVRNEDAASRTLRVDNKAVFEGRFFMKKNGFVWSPDGSHFVAHLTLIGPDGAKGREMLVTRDASIVIPERSRVHEPTISDDEVPAYVYADDHGRRVVVDGVATERFSYAWNLFREPNGTVAANALIRGQIHRIELIRGR